MPSEPPQPPQRDDPAEPSGPEQAPKPPESQGKSKPERSGRGWQSTGQLASTGMELGLTIAVLILLGWWLDGLWGTSPWLTLTGTVIATIGCTYKMLRISAAMDDKRKNK